MKRTFLLLFGLIVAICAQAARDISFAGIQVHLPDSAEAAAIIGKGDGYTQSFSRFDLQSRLQSTGKVTEQDYLLNAAKQVRSWTEEEMAAAAASLQEIQVFLDSNKIRLPLPERINIIRTTCLEEFGAEGYTRGNSIFLSTQHEGTLGVHMLAHELFHVFSRYHPVVRDQLYAVFGFKPCNPVDMKKALGGLNVTNPDCPEIAHYTTVKTEEGTKDLVIILYGKRPYEGGGKIMETYLGLGLMELAGGEQKEARMKDGSAVILAFEDVPEIFENIGTNTTYILHPEEICAEHFAMIITGKKLQQPGYAERMSAVLKN